MLPDGRGGGDASSRRAPRRKSVNVHKVPIDGMILDVGPASVAHMAGLLANCKTLLWNGRMGAFEISPFGEGTFALAREAAKLTKAGSLVSVAGGGDTVAALNAAGVADDFTYVSTAGGAFLEWLEGQGAAGRGGADAVKGVRAVIFDLDGTLADSAPDIANALNATLVAAGYGAHHLEIIKTMVGGGANVLVERALRAHGTDPDVSRVEQMLADFLVRYRAQPCAVTVLYPGALNVLNACRDAGFSLGICTNKPADLTEMVLDGLGVRAHFRERGRGHASASTQTGARHAAQSVVRVGRRTERGDHGRR